MLVDSSVARKAAGDLKKSRRASAGEFHPRPKRMCSECAVMLGAIPRQDCSIGITLQKYYVKNEIKSTADIVIAAADTDCRADADETCWHVKYTIGSFLS